jgi:hypothetical protein
MDENDIWNQEEDFTKVNQHYVPRFWQRRFADAKNVVYGRYGASFDPDQNPKKRGRARIVGVADTMTNDCTYSLYNEYYQPYDVLENLLPEAEGKMKKSQDLILDPKTTVTNEVKSKFCWGIALSVCRLPHVMKQAYRKRAELTFVYSQIGDMDRVAFEEKLGSFGQTITDADYEALKARPRDGLIRTAGEFSKLSPQNPSFPEQDALDAVSMVTAIFSQMDLVLLSTGGPSSFILGDTPMPDFDLVGGFTVPLSKTDAARFGPLSAVPIFTRAQVSQAEVESINQEQYNNSVRLVIGPDPVYLDSLKS